MLSLFEKAAELEKQNVAFAVVTITMSVGSTPRSQAKMIVLADGTTFGTVGGGASEHLAIERAKTCIAEERNDTIDCSLAVTEGHACGGALQMFIEFVPPAFRLILIGGGHVNLEIARLASACSFHLELVETRREFASVERFPWVRDFHVGSTVEQALASVVIDSRCALVIATHNLDRQVLEQVISSPATYIGMLGSRTKVNGYRRHLLDTKGIDPSALKRLYSPIGLDIGSETPEQIAVSVLAELMMVTHGRDGRPLSRKAENLVIVRGAGDLATGVIVRLHKAGYRVLALETDRPTTIRRTVAFSEAMYEGTMVVEGVRGRRASSVEEAKSIMDTREVALLCDPEGSSILSMHPAVVVDAIIAKRNIGTTLDMAPLVIALGPGFTAGKDCHFVIETQRGHDLGRVISSGTARANTGVPGMVDCVASERVVRSPASGIFVACTTIGQLVKAGDVIATVGRTEVRATIDGVLRGLLHDNLEVPKDFKVADIDPRGKSEYCTSISDKGRAIGGAVLEAIDAFHARAC